MRALLLASTALMAVAGAAHAQAPINPGGGGGTPFSGGIVTTPVSINNSGSITVTTTVDAGTGAMVLPVASTNGAYAGMTTSDSLFPANSSSYYVGGSALSAYTFIVPSSIPSANSTLGYAIPVPNSALVGPNELAYSTAGGTLTNDFNNAAITSNVVLMGPTGTVTATGTATTFTGITAASGANTLTLASSVGTNCSEGMLFIDETSSDAATLKNQLFIGAVTSSGGTTTLTLANGSTTNDVISNTDTSVCSPAIVIGRGGVNSITAGDTITVSPAVTLNQPSTSDVPGGHVLTLSGTQSSLAGGAVSSGGNLTVAQASVMAVTGNLISSGGGISFTQEPGSGLRLGNNAGALDTGCDPNMSALSPDVFARATTCSSESTGAGYHAGQDLRYPYYVTLYGLGVLSTCEWCTQIWASGTDSLKYSKLANQDIFLAPGNAGLYFDGCNSIGIGYQVMQGTFSGSGSNTINLSTGCNNIVIGRNSLVNINSGALSNTGSYNFIMGTFDMNDNVTGSYNWLFSHNGLNSCVSCSYNFIEGYNVATKATGIVGDIIFDNNQMTSSITGSNYIILAAGSAGYDAGADVSDEFIVSDNNKPYFICSNGNTTNGSTCNFTGTLSIGGTAVSAAGLIQPGTANEVLLSSSNSTLGGVTTPGSGTYCLGNTNGSIAWGSCNTGGSNSNGTLYQFAYYGATGNVLSGQTSLVTDAGGDIIDTNSGTSSTAFVVGSNGATNPVLAVSLNSATSSGTTSTLGWIMQGDTAAGANPTLSTAGTAGATITTGNGNLDIGPGATGKNLNVQFGGQTRAVFQQNVFTFDPSTGTGTAGRLIFNAATDTAVTASTNSPEFIMAGATRTHAAGAIALQLDNEWGAFTHAITSGNTLTNVGNVQISLDSAGTSTTITSETGLYIGSSASYGAQAVAGTVGTAYAADLWAPTGATNDYAMRLTGDLLLQGATPTLSSCGSGTLSSGAADNGGQITGITAATTCTITFGQKQRLGLGCFIQGLGSALPGSDTTSISQTSVVFGFTLFTGNAVYVCS